MANRRTWSVGLEPQSRATSVTIPLCGGHREACSREPDMCHFVTYFFKKPGNTQVLTPVLTDVLTGINTCFTDDGVVA